MTSCYDHLYIHYTKLKEKDEITAREEKNSIPLEQRRNEKTYIQKRENRQRERERESVCVCVCVRVRERERERERA